MGQMSLTKASVALLLLIYTTAATVIPLRELHFTSDRYSQSYETRAAGEEYRLPPTVTPHLYTITLTPNYTDYNTFNGEVTILVTALSDVNNISLHYDKITIVERSITEIIGSEIALEEDNNDSYDNTTNIYTLTLSNNQTLTSGRSYFININYTGLLLDDMAGFYRSSYKTADGEERWLATTQFEPTDARRAFPCFDEPGLKAVFQIKIRRPTNMTSISNAPLARTEPSPDDGLVTDIFRTTPRMSTYLVAFIVSDFKSVNTTDDNHLYQVWAREDSRTQGEYGLSVSPGIIQFMEDFTNISFVFEKLDQAAIPDFSAGAMENWALVTYRERLLLYKNDTSTTSSKQNIATVIAHELSHQWFGDLVSPAWWDYLWLNEGFATYFEYFATHAVERQWRLDHQFVADVHQYALAADASNTTHPITTSVYSPPQISSIFDTISYDKAGSIIRTAEHFLTHDVFVQGLRKHLNNKAYNSATADDLFAALQEAADDAKVYLNVTRIMESWTRQAGYPLITANRTSNGSIHITQERFLLSGESEADPKTTWWVPITYTRKNSIDFTTTKPNVWLENEPQVDIATTLADDEWFILNIQETAFYRVLYDEQNYKLLIDYLNSENHNKIHLLNKAQLLDDSLNLARAGLIKYATALDLTTYLARETDYIPWVSYFSGLTFLNSRLAGTEDYDNFKSYVLNLTDALYNTVQFTAPANDEHTRKLLRTITLTWACNFDKQKCLDSASEFFTQWKDGNNSVNSIPPDLRSVVYCSALSNGGEEEWNFLWDQYKKSDVATDQVLILAALGCTKNATLLNRYLQYSISPDSGIRTQDSQSVFSAVYSRAEGVDVAFKFLTDNIEDIKNYYTAMNAIRNIISGIASRMTTNEQREKLSAFLEANKDELGIAPESVLAAVDTNLQWLKNYRQDISAWLAGYNSEPETTTPELGTTTSVNETTTPELGTTTSVNETTTPEPDAASHLSLNPIMSIIILSGYLIAKY